MFFKKETIRQGFLLCSIIILLQFFSPFSSSSLAQVSWSQVYGKVTDKDTGEGIPLMWVCALKVEDRKVTQSFKERTNSRGVFLIDQVPSGDYLIFPYPARGYVSSLPENTTYIAPGRTGLSGINIEFALEKGGGVAGRVYREDGSAIPGAEITVIIEGGNSGSVTTDEQGNYEIFGLTPTVNAVMFVEPPGYAVVKKENITIIKNQVTSGVNITLQELNKIEGKVTDTAGNPIKEAIVIINSEENIGSTNSNISGNYSIAGLSAGNYELQVWKPCYVAKKEIVSIEEGVPKVLNIRLQKDTTFECPPEWQGYNPSYLPYSAEWYLNQPSRGIFAEDLPMNAEFTLTGVPPGCCPCPPCDDCPGGKWVAATAQVIGNLGIIGKEYGVVVYKCGSTSPPVFCTGVYDCTIYGLAVGFGITLSSAEVTGAPCVSDLEGKSGGIVISAGVGIFGGGRTVLWGSSLYKEWNAGLSVGADIGHIRCNTTGLTCESENGCF